MYVVLESYLQMVADYPSAYEGQPGFEFLREVPTNWDETKVLSAELGSYVTIARRKGNEWYIGSINNSEEKTIEIPMNFLSDGKYVATLYSDAPDADQHPNKLAKKIQTVTKTEVLKVNLAKGGGQVMRLVKEAL